MAVKVKSIRSSTGDDFDEKLDVCLADLNENDYELLDIKYSTAVTLNSAQVYHSALVIYEV